MSQSPNATDKAALAQIDLKKQAPAPQRGRDTKLQQLGRQTVSTLYMLVRNVKMYDPDNDIFVQPFENLRNAVNTIVAVDGAFQNIRHEDIIYFRRYHILLFCII